MDIKNCPYCGSVCEYNNFNNVVICVNSKCSYSHTMNTNGENAITNHNHLCDLIQADKKAEKIKQRSDEADMFKQQRDEVINLLNEAYKVEYFENLNDVTNYFDQPRIKRNLEEIAKDIKKIKLRKEANELYKEFLNFNFRTEDNLSIKFRNLIFKVHSFLQKHPEYLLHGINVHYKAYSTDYNKWNTSW